MVISSVPFSSCVILRRFICLGIQLFETTTVLAGSFFLKSVMQTGRRVAYQNREELSLKWGFMWWFLSLATKIPNRLRFWFKSGAWYMYINTRYISLSSIVLSQIYLTTFHFFRKWVPCVLYKRCLRWAIMVIDWVTSDFDWWWNNHERRIQFRYNFDGICKCVCVCVFCTHWGVVQRGFLKIVNNRAINRLVL